MKVKTHFGRRACAAALAAIMAVPAAVAGIQANQVNPEAAVAEAAPDDYRVIAYVTQWNWPGTDDPMVEGDAVANVDVSTVTHINYAFGHIVNAQGSNYSNGFTGAVDVPDPDKLRALVKLKEKNPDLKVLLSVGGWGMDGFCPIVNDAKLRQNFVKSCTEIMKEFGLDGIDLDYEYPGTSADKYDKLVCPHALSEGGADERNGHNDGDMYLELFKDFRNYEEFGWDHLLTIASGVGYDWMVSVPTGDIPNYLDFINIMCYDLYGDWTDHSDFNANLYPTANNPLSYDVVCNRLAYRGYPRDIMNIGLPIYGRDRKMGKGDASWLTYDQIMDLVDQGLTVKLDPTAKASIASGTVDGRTYEVTFDSKEDIKLKCDWIQDSGFGGGMYWEYSQDTQHGSELTKYIWDCLNGSGRKKNPPAPSPRYVNTTSYPEWKSYLALNSSGGNAETVWYNGKVYKCPVYTYHQGTYGWIPTFAPEYALDGTYYSEFASHIPSVSSSYSKEWELVEDLTAQSAVPRGEASKTPGKVDSSALQVRSSAPSSLYAKPGATISWDMNVSGGSGSYQITNQVWFIGQKYDVDGYVKTEKRRTGGPYPLAGAGGTGETMNKISCTPESTTDANNKVSATFNDEGEYLIFTQVTDSTGKMAAKFSQIVNITNEEIPLIATVSASTNGFTDQKAQNVTWTANAEGANGEVTYKIDIYKDGVLYSEGTQGTSNTRTLSLQQAGTYTAKVTVKDSAVSASTEGGKVVVTKYMPLELTSLTTDGNTSVGNTITLTATAANGTAPYKYSFYVTKGGKVITSRANGITNTFNFKPTEAGTYQIRAYVTDRNGKRAVKAINLKITQ